MSDDIDSYTAERLALIAGGKDLTLEQAVREILGVADDMLDRGRRPPEAHGGCYLSRWRLERLRAALRAAGGGA